MRHNSDQLSCVPKRPALKPRIKSNRSPNPNFAAISASGYFEEAVQVSVPSRDLDFRVYYTQSKVDNGTVMVCHHGAGYSGLSFACFAKEVTDMTKSECGVLSFDARCHGLWFCWVSLMNGLMNTKGKTTTLKGGSESSDLSIGALVEDFGALLQTIYPDPAAAPTFLVCSTYAFAA